MDWQAIDWSALERLRAAFLAGSAGDHDYWRDERDLASYDQTFAQRIGWKWDYVLGELKGRGWQPPEGPLLDWGCGSGVAGRALVDCYGAENIGCLLLWDRSALAMQFAMRGATERFPRLAVSRANPCDARFGTLLLSHVLTELDDRQADALLEMACKATAVLWVEPGTHQASRRLSVLRERLRGSFNLVAPCTHQAACGMLAPENAAHWCHHFAKPPPEVFTDGNWTRFGALAGVDLRSLPLSFLVLDKRPVPPRPEGSVRVIGHPQLFKGHAQLLACDATGLCERRLSKRILPEHFRQLKKRRIDPSQVWECDKSEIVTIGPAELPKNSDP